jgi:hypothetical protein
MSATKPTKSRPERFALRVAKGGFTPADVTTLSRLKARNFRTGELVFAEFKRPRNPGFHRLAHALGVLFVTNIEAFEHLDSHTCLKRLQLETGVGCEEVLVNVQTVWPRVVEWVGQNIGAPLAVVLQSALDVLGGKATQIPVLIPRSLSYESMDQSEFNAVVTAICSHVSKTYWPSLTAQQIAAMADAMVEPA